MFHKRTDLDKLKRACTYHYKELGKLRKAREAFLSAAAGTLYPHSKDTGLQDILGLMRQAAESMALSIAAQQPKIAVYPNSVDKLAFSLHYENAIDQYSKTLFLGKVLQRCVRNAFYMIGIAKVHMAEGAAIMIESDEWMDPGRPFVEDRSFHHMSYDSSATDFRLCSFISDRYMARLSDVLENKEFKGSTRRQIHLMSQGNEEAQKEEWGRTIGGSEEGQWYDRLYLADVFCNKDGVIYTYPVDAQYNFLTEDPLIDIEWDGDETGPYKWLNFGPIPDKSTPSAPAQNLLLLHNLINTLYRKLRDQADRQKNVTVGRKGQEDDNAAMAGAEDGDHLSLNEPEGIETITIDGPNQSNFAFALNAMQQFSKQAGNLEQQLGLGSSADTYGQEQMIGAGVSRMEASYQARFTEFTQDIVKQLGKLLFNDNVTEVPMMGKVTGTDYQFDDKWQGAMQEGSREGEDIDYDVDIVPHSQEYRSPRQRLQDIDETWDRMMAVAPMVLQSGKIPNVDGYLKLRARYTGVPELETLFLDNQTPPEEEGGQPPSSPNGGEYTHKSQPSGQSNGSENEAIGQMMASSQNSSNGMTQ